jgi:hypothetical protein
MSRSLWQWLLFKGQSPVYFNFMFGSFEVVNVDECFINLVHILEYSILHRDATFDSCLQLHPLTPKAPTICL